MVTRVTAQELAEAVKERRTELALTLADIKARGGPSAPVILAIEQARKRRRLNPSTLTKLDVAMGWQPGHSQQIYGEHFADSPVLADVDHLAALRASAATLIAADDPAAGAAVLVFAHAVVPNLLDRVQRLTSHDLFALDADEILRLDEVLEELFPTTPAGSENSTGAENASTRTVARLPDGRTVALRVLRVEHDFTQDGLAKALTEARRAADPSAQAVSVSTISGIEWGPGPQSGLGPRIRKGLPPTERQRPEAVVTGGGERLRR